MSFLLRGLTFAASLYLVFALCAILVVQVENKSFFGIGKRIIGDQLLLKDVLQTPPISLTKEPDIRFQYAIVEPITYLEIESDKNVHANVKFSYELDLVEGTVSTISTASSKPESFNVLIRIYGFNETMDINPAYVLNKNQEINGILKPIYKPINNSLNLEHEEQLTVDSDFENYDDVDEDDDDDDAINTDKEDIVYDEDDFDNSYDKIIEQGQRQEGDFLVYESNQTSATTTAYPANHSITFYYIDIYYITYVKFVLFEHFLYHNVDDYASTYVVEYAHISPTTLKAVVTDRRTTNLFVQMQMYGFHPTALPVAYKPFLSNSQTAATASPISSLTKLKILMNAQQSAQQQQQPKELEHNISTENESNVICVQQVPSSLPKTGNNSERTFAHRSIFSAIITIFLSMMIAFA